jgi:ABC-2 type transport system ATP-binding protein
MIEINNIYKTYNRKPALIDVSLKLDAGKITGLLGPNGAGKTTLIRILNQLTEPESGNIRYKGDLLTQNHVNLMGYLPEERGLYRQMKVQEHVLFLAKLRGMNGRDAQQNFNFWLEKWNIGDWRKKRIEELSKGMAQKIQFIAAVLHEPEFLVLDEPFSGFDPMNADLIRQELIEMRAKGKTIVLSTHNMKSVEELCDKAVLIHEARKIADGKVATLRENQKSGEYAVKFTGNMISFVNALWTGFELVDKEILADDRFIAKLKMRGENTFEDLLKVLIGQVKIEAAWEVLPSMDDVFVNLVTPKLKENV